MYHVKILRSPADHGQLEEIRSPKLSGSYTLITAADIPGINELSDFPAPVIAGNSISYIGEPVGLLAGPDLFRLESYADKCVIKIKEQPVLPDQSDHPEQQALQESEKNNYFYKLRFNSADTEYFPQASNRIVTGLYNTGAADHWFSEPHTAAADFTGGKLTVYTATQWPYQVKRSLSRVLAIPESSITVIQTELGIHMDGKLMFSSLVSCQAALAAYITGKPIKLKINRIEGFRWSPKRSASKTGIVSVLGDSGSVLNTDINISVDMGSQDVFAKEILGQACLGSMGIYNLGHLNLEGIALKTAKPPQGPMEGFGASQGFFASERHVSRIADSLRQDPAVWRKENCLGKNDNLAVGTSLRDGVPVQPLIDSVAAGSDYYRKWASYELLRINRKQNWEISEHESKRGIGIAIAYQGSGFLYPGNDRGIYSVEMTLGKDGSLEIRTSTLMNREEEKKIWCALALRILGVEENQVTVVNSPASPDSGPCCLSRNITAVTRLVERGCEAIRKMRFRDPLPIVIKRSVKPAKFIPWNGQNGGDAGDSLAFCRPSWGAAVTEVEIDNVTLEPKVRGIWLVVDGGKIMSETGARRALKTAAINALSWTTREQIIYENGIIPQNIIQNYIFLTPEEIPPVNIEFFNNGNSNPKGIGELPWSCIPASYVQAVSQAMDYPFEKIPLTVEDIWAVMKNKQSEAAV
ncbi:MAG: molybdopterin-dependent oxidoreductase [Treponema sp.]|nr:molybdopterin-dependent oxidoreductase [Treponema sp.]